MTVLNVWCPYNHSNTCVRACARARACVRAGLSRRVIVKDAETGRTQTYGVSSDVLAQQFALRVSSAEILQLYMICN